MGTGSGSGGRDGLFRLLEPVVAAVGVDLEDLDVQPAGRRRLLRVIVDRDGGISLDDVAAVSTRVSQTLDESDAMGGGAYVLEVTSPGVDRPLRSPRHWRRNSGRLVRASLTGGGEVTGRVLHADDEGVRLDVEGSERPLAWSEVSVGRVQVEFARVGSAHSAESAESAESADSADEPEGGE